MKGDVLGKLRIRKQQCYCCRREDGASGRITRLRLALRAVAEATLSSLVPAMFSQTMKQQYCCYLREDGASGRIRTSDRSVRSRVLYPAELRMHRDLLLYCLVPHTVSKTT